MARYRPRRKRKSPRTRWIAGSLVIMAGVWTYGQFVSPVLEGDGSPAHRTDGGASQASRQSATPFADAPRLTSTRPEKSDDGAGRNVPGRNVPERGARETPVAAKPIDPQQLKRAKSLAAAGLKAERDGEIVAARAYLTEAIGIGLDSQMTLDVRAALTRIGAETIFGPAIHKDDPFVGRHTISAGETLGKIAKKYAITADFLAAINGIVDKNRIRAGQTLKVVRGPFHVRIYKKAYGMDVYLQDTFVRHFSVGLGVEGSTPTGEWTVGTKLENPTYYPPRSGDIVAADDPENPLGEYWIELKGISGNALGQQRYGIHGTNEPDSIGRSESLGCVRMHNADVAELYTYLIPQKSRVTIAD